MRSTFFSGDSVVTLFLGPDITERLRLSFCNIYLLWFFYVVTFIKRTGWWNRPCFIYEFYSVFCLSYLRKPWFIQWPSYIQWNTFVRFIADGFTFFTFRCLWFICFVDGVNFLPYVMSDWCVHNISLCFLVINPFFWKISL